MADEDYDGGDFDLDIDGEIVEGELEVGEAEEDVQFDASRTVAKEQKTLQYLYAQHPEAKLLYIEQVQEKLALRSYPPENDPIHKSQPFLTLYERTKILGYRENQLANGARPFVDVPAYVTEVKEIARTELEQKRLPFIIARPMPDGSFEYWRMADLMIL
jgi:DNA-directed RNA polymerase subunit K/omega